MWSVSALTGADVSRLHSSRECEMQMRAWGYSCTTVVDSQSFSLDGSPPWPPSERHISSDWPHIGSIIQRVLWGDGFSRDWRRVREGGCALVPGEGVCPRWHHICLDKDRHSDVNLNKVWGSGGHVSSLLCGSCWIPHLYPRVAFTRLKGQEVRVAWGAWVMLSCLLLTDTRCYGAHLTVLDVVDRVSSGSISKMPPPPPWMKSLWSSFKYLPSSLTSVVDLHVRSNPPPLPSLSLWDFDSLELHFITSRSPLSVSVCLLSCHLPITW